jgi:hypothetical protein
MIRDYLDLAVYQKVFEEATRILELTQDFAEDEDVLKKYCYYERRAVS